MERRFFAIILILAFAASLCACGVGDASANGGEGGSGESKDTTTVASETVDNSTDENGYLRDALPDDLDFSGKTVSIYVRGDNLSTEYFAEEDGDVVNDAIYNRNKTVEERLNVTLNYFANTGTNYWDERNKYVDTVRSSVMANDGSMDIIGALSYMSPYMAEEGLLLNLISDDIPYLEFDSPWWSESLINELAIGDRLYYVSGDASLGLRKGMFCFYFNKEIIESMNLDDPYALVDAGSWTLDKMSEMASAAYRDLNGNSSVDYDEDQMGLFVLSIDFLPNFLISSGLRMTERDDNGRPYAVLGSEGVLSFFERMTAIMEQEYAGVSQTNTDHQNIFHEGRTLFLAAQFSTAETMRDIEQDFGIIPYPKYDETQDDYRTTSRALYSAFSIPITADIESSAAVLEAIASESYRTVTPAYYESALKTKYSRDDISSHMFDIICDSVCYEFGIFHSIKLNGITTDIREVLSGVKKNGWASTWASREQSFNTVLNTFIDNLEALD